MKVCQNQFEVGKRYIYSFDNYEGHTEALVEIVKKTNRCAIIKFVEVYEEHTRAIIFLRICLKLTAQWARVMSY